jgi:transaldolase
VHLYLDSADERELRAWLRLPMVHGVTTNPVLQQRAGLREADLEGFVLRLLAQGARAVQVQVQHRETDAIIEDARRISSWADIGTVIPKVPASPEGLAAVSELASEGVRCTVTAVFESEQALWALLAGAAYAAPYLGRISDAGRDGIAAIAAMQRVLAGYGDQRSPCRLLVASVRSRADFLALLDLGVGAITVRPSLLAELVSHPATAGAEAEFLAAAESLR